MGLANPRFSYTSDHKLPSCSIVVLYEIVAHINGNLMKIHLERYFTPTATAEGVEGSEVLYGHLTHRFRGISELAVSQSNIIISQLRPLVHTHAFEVSIYHYIC